MMVGCALPLFRFEIYVTESIPLLGQINPRSIKFGLELIHARRINFLAHLRTFVICLEGLLNLLALVHEVQNEGVLLKQVDAIEP